MASPARPSHQVRFVDWAHRLSNQAWIGYADQDRKQGRETGRHVEEEYPKPRTQRGRPRLPRGRRRRLEGAPGRARAARRALGAVPEHPRGHPGTRGLGAPRGPVGGVRVDRVPPPGHGAGAGGAASAVAGEPEPREALREGARRRRQDGQGGRPGAGQAGPGAAGGSAPRAAARRPRHRRWTTRARRGTR